MLKRSNQIALKLAKLIQKGLEVIVLSGRYQRMLLINFHINGRFTCHMSVLCTANWPKYSTKKITLFLSSFVDSDISHFKVNKMNRARSSNKLNSLLSISCIVKHYSQFVANQFKYQLVRMLQFNNCAIWSCMDFPHFNLFYLFKMPTSQTQN